MNEKSPKTLADTYGDTLDEASGDDLVHQLYQELRRLAAVKLRRLPMGGQSLQATALVHEVYLRLGKSGEKTWKGPRHFFRAAALAMRHILIERARARAAEKHGGHLQRVDITVTLPGDGDAEIMSAEDILTLDQLLSRLLADYPDLVEIVYMRYFCGLTVAEIAELMGASTRTIERKWSFARAWLQDEMSRTPDA